MHGDVCTLVEGARGYFEIKSLKGRQERSSRIARTCAESPRALVGEGDKA